MSTSFDQVIGDTLAQVNVVREAFGYNALSELPDARPGDTKDCLYFRALKDVGARSVGSNSVIFSSERQAQLVAELWGTEVVDGKSMTVRSPQGIVRTIGKFDSNQLAHYDV